MGGYNVFNIVNIISVVGDWGILCVQYIQCTLSMLRKRYKGGWV